jgi:F-type H+-transporting ATPase subunit alpha
MNSNQSDLLAKINKTGDWSDDIAAELQAAIDDFKANHTW